MDAPDLDRLARTIGDATRIRMLSLLMEGRALTAKELAYGAGVGPATATGHLRRLTDDGLVACAAEGRHKFFRLAGARVARMLESMMIVAPRTRRPGPMARPTDDPLRVARVCYDHLAGRLGTRITHALAQRRVLRAVGTDLTLTAAGEVWCASFGMDTAALRAARRRFAYPCFDWTERRHHVGGAFGAALAERLLGLGWIARTRESRVLAVTPLGRRALAKQLGVRLR